MNKKTNKILILTLFILLIFLISAYIIEYVLGHKPCKLCVYQRFPYFVSIFLVSSILLLKKYVKLSLLGVSLVSLLGAFVAFYHFGIEQGFFSESFICEAQNLRQSSSKEEILKQLKENNISCKNVTFKAVCLSLALINTIFSFILFYIFLKLFKNYEFNK